MKPRTRKEREVWHALGSLLEQGLRSDDMTGEVIGDRLLELGYNRGSNSDIYRFKRTWIITQNADTEGGSHGTNPLQMTLSDPITKAAQILQEKLKSEAQHEIDKIKKEADEKISHAKITIDKFERDLSEVTEKKEQLQQRLNELEKEKDDLSKSLQNEITKHHGTQQREIILCNQIKTMQHDHTLFINDLKATQTENIDHIKQQMSEIASNHKAEINDYKTLLENHRQQYNTELNDLKVKSEKLIKSLYESQNNLKQNEFTLENKEREINRLESDLITLKKDHKTMASQIKETDKAYSEKLEDKEKQLYLTQGRLEQGLQELKKYEEKNKCLQAELISSKERIVALESQCQFEDEPAS